MPSLRFLAAATIAGILFGSPALAAADSPDSRAAAGIGEIRVEPRMQPATFESKVESAKANRGRARSVHATTIPLDPPAPSALLPAPESQGKPGTPLQIGFGRDVPALATEDDAIRFLSHEPQADGSIVLAASINSPGALAMRLGLRVRKLPAGAILRFYSPDEAMLFEVTAGQVLESIARNLDAGENGADAYTYWSAPIEGATVVVEIELPAGSRLSDLRVSVPQISHMVASAETGFTVAKAMMAKAGPCQIDASCQVAAWGAQMNSVARMVFTASGSTYLCTGTLIADSISATFIPYFLTANHCISTQASASSLVTYWFFRSSACNSGIAGPYQTLVDGATLLMARATTDTSFLRLNSAPPAGAVFAGWIVNSPPPVATAITGIHHPGGDLEKISFGQVSAYTLCTPPTNGQFSCSYSQLAGSTFYEVQWSSGVTEPGSSGSALFQNNGKYVIGQLYGGSSSCASPASGDYYGRFDDAYFAGLNQWLAPAALTLTVAKQGPGSGLVTSSPAGINCGSACGALFDVGTVVTLTAIPVAGSTFTGWSGACSGVASCVVTMNIAKAVSASFAISTSSRRGAPDFNGDGRTDVLWRRSDGANYLWQVDGTFMTGGMLNIIGQSALPTVDPTWFVAGMGDFNGDGKSDILWRNSSGDNYIWHLAGPGVFGGPATIVSQGLLPGADSSWSVAGIGDFDGDGKADILWRKSDGTNFVWLIDGNALAGGVIPIAGAGMLPSVDTSWSVAGLGDFNGDGKADILWRKSDGTNYVWNVNGAVISGGLMQIVSQGLLPGADTSWSVAAVGDFNGDGKSDILFRRSDGTNYVWQIDGASIAGGMLSIASQGLLPLVDTTWSVVGHGDYNGDGKSDVFWRRNDGTNYVWHVDGATIAGGLLSIPTQGLLPSVDNTWTVIDPK